MREITFGDIWDVFVRNIVPIVLAAVVCLAVLFTYSKVFLKPLYSSTSTLYILKQENSGEYTSSDFNLALNVVSDCSYMIKSHEVLDDVISELDLKASYSALSGAISINNPDSTRIIEVTVKTSDPGLSKRIVDSVCGVAAKKINDTMGLDQVNVYAKGTLENSQCNTIGKTKYALACIGAGALVYAIYLVAFMLDDRIKGEEDIERYLGKSVLGQIPNSSGSGKNSRYKGYNRYYNRYSGGRRGYYSYGSYKSYGAYGAYGGAAYRSSVQKQQQKEDKTK